jgi:putative ABC transport system permease protein
LLAVPIEPALPRYQDPSSALTLYRELADAVAAVPGVRSVALTNHVPLSGASMPSRIEVDGAPADRDNTDTALFREVDAGYFRTAGIPILAGRDFSSADIARPGDAVLVNQFLAQRYWPGRNPIGQRLTVSKSAQGRPDFGERIRATVVGVVGNVRHYALDADLVPEVYLPYTITAWPRMALLARVGIDPGRAALELKRTVLAVEPDLPLEGAFFQNGVYPVTRSLDDTLAYRRLVADLLIGFAAPALLLAAIGIYGVVAYLVAQRGREIAIRMALGASRASVLRLVLGQGSRLILAGVGIGLLGALGGGRLLRSQLYQVGPTDPVSLLAAAMVLVTVGLLAIYSPARRASGIDPMRTLRSE